MTAPPRDPYVWHDVGAMCERDTLRHIKAPYPPMFVSNPRQAGKSWFWGRAWLEPADWYVHDLRRQRVLDQATINVAIKNQSICRGSVRLAVAELRGLVDVPGFLHGVAIAIRAEFARLWKEQA
jgi:hypothetical protein